jgi:exopolysaccharide biosynthesis polyprenyl glycosylphosphotransferase
MPAESLANTSATNSPTESIQPSPRDTLILLHEGIGRRTESWLGASLRRPLAILVLAVMDVCAAVVGIALAGYLVDGQSPITELGRFVPILVTVWLTVFVAWDLYVLEQNRRNVGTLVGAILSGTGILALGAIMYPQAGFSLNEVLLATLFIVLLEGGVLALYKQGRGLIPWQRASLTPTLIIGRREERARVRQAIEKNYGSYACVGELNASAEDVDLPLLRQALDRTGAKNLILAAGAGRLPHIQFKNLLRSMRLRNVTVNLVPDVNTLTDAKPMVLQEDLGIPLLEVGSSQLDSAQWAMKRMLDIAGSLAGLLVLSPLLMIIAILIKLTSSGPVLFRQKRVGADEKVFTCYKFRSMYDDAERRQAELEAQNEAGGVIFKIKNDPRITPIGHVIRASSIDELPQLINVLKGEMSLVGPRPLPLRDFERMGEKHKKRLAIVPGITGYWQTSGRSDLSFEDMLRLDVYYIENWSLSLDIKILFRTILVVLRRDGAC